MIETEDLTKFFDNFLAVEGLSLTVDSGQLLVILGPNGAGKTTTVRMLASVLSPSRGWARVAGYDVVRQSAQVRASVGVMTEHHGFYGRMRALDYLVFFGQLYGLDSNDCHRRSLRLLDEFGLGEYRYRRVAHYSRGMLQKLALARALLHEPPVLLLDEPTSSLDPESAVLVRDAIEELRSSERTIVICTHNLAEAEILADQIAIIRDGRIIAQGSIEKLKTAWLGLPEYKVQLAEAYPTDQVQIPGALEITAWGPDWLHFRPRHAALENPLLLKSLLDQGLPVMGVVEVPRSLEQVYLEVMNGVSETGENHVA